MAGAVEVVPHDPSWTERFGAEKSRILATLGHLADGGVVERLEHIGSTAVPGMPAKPCVDIVMAAWPMPLPPEAVAALEGLGYTYRGENGIPGREYFTQGPHDFHLHVVQGDSDFITDHLLFRDFLRAEPAAARRYAATKRELAARFPDERDRYQAGKSPLIEELLDAARRWYRERLGFSTLFDGLAELRGWSRDWMVSSGWAVDLYLGRVTRVHHDLDVAVFRDDQLALREHLGAHGWRFVTPFEGRLEPWPPGMRLELPRHQVHAHREGAFIDVLLTERHGGVWRFRRDPRVVRTLDRLVLQGPGDVPFIAPEVTLLYKSATSGGDPRPRDVADFENVMAHGLEPERRAWLRWALQLYRPTHPWLGSLA